MYQRGRKLAAIQASRKDMLELAVMQREAYVVALNALSLLDAKSAWFVLSSVSSTTQDIVRKICPSIYALLMKVTGKEGKETMQIHP